MEWAAADRSLRAVVAQARVSLNFRDKLPVIGAADWNQTRRLLRIVHHFRQRIRAKGGDQGPRIGY